MFKRFLSVIAMLAVFSTTALAGEVIPPPEVPPGLFAQEMTIDVDTIDPSAGQYSQINFTLTENAQIYATAQMAAAPIVVASLAASRDTPATANAGEAYSINFYGTKDSNSVNGEALDDGDYVIFVQIKEDGAADFAPYTFNVSVATQVENENAPKINNFTVTPAEFDASAGESANVRFDISEDTFVSVVVEDQNNNVVRTFPDFMGELGTYKVMSDNTIGLSWNGRDNGDNVVANGAYTVKVSTSKSSNSNVYTAHVRVNNQQVVEGNGFIRSIQLSPSGDWDPERGELEIEIDFNKDVRRLIVRLQGQGEVVEIADEDNVDENDVTFYADGFDDDGDILRTGDYKLVVIADGEIQERSVRIDYEPQELLESFLSKEEFDPSQSEFSYLILKSGTSSDITVELYRNNQIDRTLVDGKAINKNRYYSVFIDGLDGDGDEMIPGENWKLKVTAENPYDDNISSVEWINLDIDNDEVSDRKSNVTVDYVAPVIFDDRDTDKVEFNFCVDKDDTDVTVEIFEGTSTSGVDYKIDETPVNKGCYTFVWNIDRNIDNGVYTYKVIAETSRGSRETEVGRFAVGTIGGSDDKKSTCEEGYEKVDGKCVKKTVTCPEGYVVSDGVCITNVTPPTGSCGGYVDTTSVDYDTCQAIEWVTQEGIFMGNNGNFRPFDYIDRAETLKTVLTAMDASLLPVDGTNLGFIDVQPGAWYATYARTAQANGFLSGYATNFGQEARLGNTINRVEFLRFALDAAGKYKGLNVPEVYFTNYTDVQIGDWFAKYAALSYQYYLFNEHPAANGQFSLGTSDLVQRREVALLLYRMHKEGLLGTVVQ